MFYASAKHRNKRQSILRVSKTPVHATKCCTRQHKNLQQEKREYGLQQSDHCRCSVTVYRSAGAGSIHHQNTRDSEDPSAGLHLHYRHRGVHTAHRLPVHTQLRSRNCKLTYTAGSQCTKSFLPRCSLFDQIPKPHTKGHYDRCPSHSRLKMLFKAATHSAFEWGEIHKTSNTTSSAHSDIFSVKIYIKMSPYIVFPH